MEVSNSNFPCCELTDQLRQRVDVRGFSATVSTRSIVTRMIQLWFGRWASLSGAVLRAFGKSKKNSLRITEHNETLPSNRGR